MKTDNDQPEQSLYDRQLPEHVAIDVDGLVDAWVMDAEDWLVAYDGPEALTDREAFEGIEFVARLCRCRSEIHNRQDIKPVLESMLAVLQPIATDVIQLAISYPDLFGWRAEVEEAWKLDHDTPEVAETLLADLDAADWIAWFATEYADPLVIGEILDRYLEQVGECHDLFAKKIVMFCAAEAYIRAVGKTLVEHPYRDESGWLSSSAWKYLRLLDMLDIDIENVSEESRQLILGFAKDSQRVAKAATVGDALPNTDIAPLHLGPRESVWKVYDFAPALGAAPAELPPMVIGLRWRDPSGTYEAEATWPRRLDPSGDKTIELMFGAGEDFVEAPQALDGLQVILGNARGIVEVSGEGENQKASVVFNYSNITAGLQGVLRLTVNDAQWSFCDDT